MENLILNSSFEAGSEGWGTFECTRTNCAASQGAWCMLTAGAGTAGGEGIHTTTPELMIPVNRGGTYFMGADIAIQGADQHLFLGLVQCDSGMNLLAYSGVLAENVSASSLGLTPYGGFRRLQGSITLHNDCCQVGLILLGNRNSVPLAQMFIDNVFFASAVATFPNTLLKNTVVRTARASSISTSVSIAARQYARSVYVLKVLRSNDTVREAVRAAAAAASYSPGQRELANILVVFNLLSADDKARFIDDYSRRAVVATGGRRYVTAANLWSSQHYPVIVYPRQEP